nr:MAG: hypothetical protein DIU62_03730 [Pseudomonadota bacterium]
MPHTSPVPAGRAPVFASRASWAGMSGSTLRDGLPCITAADTRWARCDIKSVALLANVLLRQQAFEAGASEAILLRDGELTEGSASSVLVVKDGVLLAPPESPRILPSTTRRVVGEIADALGIPRRDARIDEAMLRSAEEIWLAAGTREVQPVTRLDGRPVGTGRPGPLWRRVYDEYQRIKRA